MRRPFLKWGLLLLAVAAAAVVVLVGRDVLRIKARLEAGQSAIGGLDLDAASAPGGVARAASTGAQKLVAADDLARSSPWLGLLDHVPVVGSQVDGLRDLTAAAADLGRVADGAATRIQGALDASSGSPPARVALLDVVVHELDAIDAHLHDLHPAADRTLVPPLSGARDHLAHKLDEARVKLADGRRSALALRRFLAGPTRVLVLAANNAEMTAGSGMPNSGGVATISGGDIDLGEFVQNDRTYLRGTPGLTAPGDLAALYANIGIGYDFRGTTGSPNFPVVAPLMRDMAAQAPLFGAVDGVVVVDAFVVRDLLVVAGPVEVAGTTYTADTVMQAVLHDNYLRFGDITADREQRAELQGAIARAAFDAIKTRHVALTALVKSLADDAKGRHLLAWSADPDLQQVFHDIGADGSLRPDGLLVSAENLGGNKLDWYLKPVLQIDVRRASDHGYRVDLALTIANFPRDPTTQQVEGLRPDRHFVMPDVHVPGNATELTSDDVPFKAVGADPPMIAGNLIDTIELGTTRTWHFSFHLPADQLTLTLMPSARVTPLIVSVNGFPTDDAVERPLFLPLLVTTTTPADGVVLAGFAISLVGFAFALSSLLGRRGTPALAPPGDGDHDRRGRAGFDALAATWLIGAGAVLVLVQALLSSR